VTIEYPATGSSAVTADALPLKNKKAATIIPGMRIDLYLVPLGIMGQQVSSGFFGPSQPLYFRGRPTLPFKTKVRNHYV
jgi:hypothetical protein